MELVSFLDHGLSDSAWDGHQNVLFPLFRFSDIYPWWLGCVLFLFELLGFFACELNEN